MQSIRCLIRPLATSVVILFALSGLACDTIRREASAEPPPESPGAETGDPDTGEPGRQTMANEVWNEVDRLISEAQYEAAATEVAEILAEARRIGDDAAWTRALIRGVQLRTALGGFETAVKDFEQGEWPTSAPHHLALQLYYAHALTTYLDAYSWEIRQRERVEGAGERELEQWTAEEIYLAAEAAYASVWSERESWGEGPLGALAEILEQNNYPPRIRSTLRDAVSHLWVELLGNTAYWSPEASNELFRLDLDALLSEHPETASDLGDAETHPLTKVATVLADLENWHRRGGRIEAALDARLTRLERLWGSFTEEEDRHRLTAELERSLENVDRQAEWWSVGQAQLAQWVRADDSADSLVRARQIALEAERAHPDSIGGQRARSVIAGIEAPAYSMLAMESDGIGKRSIEVTHKNLDRIHFRAYTIDLTRTVEGAKDRNLLPDHRAVSRIVQDGKPQLDWSVELPPTPDYRQHRTFVTPPIEQAGAYLVVASARRDFGLEGNLLQGVNLVLGDLVLLARGLEDGFELSARSGASGASLAGAEITVYRYDWRRGHRRAAETSTGPDGQARVYVPQDRSASYFAVARYGRSVALEPRLGSPAPYPKAVEQTATLVYTDRSVYRPLQDVQWKIVLYRGAGSQFETLADTEVQVQLFDPNRQAAASATVTTNRFGSASGTFPIPAGKLLGNWTVVASTRGSAQIQVEEYKRPTFEVEIADPAEPLRLNREAALEGEVRYYFGLPVTAGEVSWRVTREPLYPRWWWWFDPRPTQVQTIAQGEASLDAEGRFEIRFSPEADEREAERGVTYRYRLAADVTDDGGETRSASRSFRLGFTAVEATIRGASGFERSDRSTKLAVRRTDLEGVPRSGQAQWSLFALEQSAKAELPAERPMPRPPVEDDPPYRTEGDDLRPRWAPAERLATVLASWKNGAERSTGELEHGTDGEASLDLGQLPAGAYRLRYRTEDAYGTPYETNHEFLVVSEASTPLAVPAVLIAERTSVPVGESLTLFVHSARAGQEMSLEVERPGGRREVHRLSADESGLIDLPVTAEDRGGLALRLTALADYQLLQHDLQILVPWDDRKLALEFATFRDRIRPGDRETWTVKVASASGEAAARDSAELLAYMYDRSLDLFAPHRPVDPASVYPRGVWLRPVAVSLGTAHPVWRHSRGFAHVPPFPGLRVDRLKTLAAYGIGGLGRGRLAKRVAMPMQASPREGYAQESVMAVSEAPMMDQRVAADTAEGSQEAAFDDGDGAAGGGDGTGADTPPEVRENFAETAFWEPHLRVDDKGEVSFEFTVPDSLTEWNVWVHAVTTDLSAGRLSSQTQTVKELLVRPYLPRFLREGDRAEIQVLVQNAGEEELSGTLSLAVSDPESGADLAEEFGLLATEGAFTVAPGGSSKITFSLAAPRWVGTANFEIVGRAGAFSDGERRALPLLPSRVHLAQSRFATLREDETRRLTFAEMAADDDPSRIDDRLVVTVDAQLFYSVLSALPYLIDYPYECTEQTLNRFLSTGILSSLFDDYPAVAEMARRFAAERDSRLEAWGGDDPNRRIALEETPWLISSQGGPEGEDLVKALDPAVARAQREAALAELVEAQTSLGGFPWFPGGPPSPYLTLYMLSGFSRALEFGVDVPKPMVLEAWSYVRSHYDSVLGRQMVDDECCWETVTYLNWVLSAYPDTSWTNGAFSEDDRTAMLDFSFRYWKNHSPRLKAYLAVTLARAGRQEDASRVWNSVMDSAKTTQDEGTFWAPEDRSWLWYNDTIETHATALATLSELDPDDERRHGLVQWLMLNKKLGHWKSTRATAEVIYALVRYLDREGALGARESVTATIGPRTQEWVFEPDEYTGRKNQVVIEGAEIEPATMSTIEVSKGGPGMAFASATWHFSTEKNPAASSSDFFAVERSYYRRVHDGREWTLAPLAEGTALAAGDQIEVHLSLSTRHAAEYVHLRDPRAAGFEPETLTSGWRWDLGIARYEEVRDSGTNFFFERLPVGEYTFKYRLRANLPGTFRVGPATLQSMYAPEFTAYSAGHQLTVEGEQELTLEGEE